MICSTDIYNSCSLHGIFINFLSQNTLIVVAIVQCMYYLFFYSWIYLIVKQWAYIMIILLIMGSIKVLCPCASFYGFFAQGKLASLAFHIWISMWSFEHVSYLILGFSVALFLHLLLVAYNTKFLYSVMLLVIDFVCCGAIGFKLYFLILNLWNNFSLLLHS